MFELIFLAVVVVILLLIAGALFLDDAFGLGLTFTVIGAVMLWLLVFLVAPTRLPTGAPKTDISAGEYGVAYVGPSGEGHIDVLVFKSGQESKTPMTYFRLPNVAFEGDIRTDAKSLVVTEAGNFKKLQLVEVD